MTQGSARNARLERIAPGKTKADWVEFSKQLVPGGDVELWAMAFNSFFRARLQSRYLKPIAVIRDKGEWEGEGFTIASIQCALIEFLAATRAGKNYRHKKPHGPYEYGNSRDLFVKFLYQTAPFANFFSKQTANEYYSNVRCALLHEARTKDGWIIWVKGSVPVDCQKKIIYRDSFQSLIESYIEDYGLNLTNDVLLQEAFVRKLNHLSDL